ncbi:MAG: hypothetical protein EBU68_05035 [Actinobacteria bacterium]|nr:hypothetical protein [Actinomycetota bacterium]NCU80808.1 hypothetical protein [Acidimicrobiia bacterium]NDC99704.1 hypothetical protein [bacterium]HBQ51632.1 hypothetical protein [Acidimicrobium sp.]NBP42134.1 hypothetical protein [Actinomycetota bacterium]
MKTVDSTIEPGETVVQVVIAVPIVLSMLLIAIQAMLFMHSAQIASLAASKGASVAANSQGDVAMALNSATITAAELGAQLVGLPTAIIDDGFASVQVRVEVPNVAPFFPSSVLRQGLEPLESFVEEDDR